MSKRNMRAGQEWNKELDIASQKGPEAFKAELKKRMKKPLKEENCL